MVEGLLIDVRTRVVVPNAPKLANAEAISAVAFRIFAMALARRCIVCWRSSSTAAVFVVVVVVVDAVVIVVSSLLLPLLPLFLL